MASPKSNIVNLIMVLFFITVSFATNSIVGKEPTAAQLIHNYEVVLQAPFTDDMTIFVSPFDFLYKTSSEKDCFKTETTKVHDFLSSPDFYARAKSFDPKNFKADLDSYLSALIEAEMQKIKAYYEDHKARILENFETNKPSVLYTLEEGFKKETVAVFRDIYENQTCEAQLPRIKKLKQQLDKSEITMSFLLDHKQHSFSSTFYLNIFLDESACHKQVFETLFPSPVKEFLNEVQRHVETCFLEPLFSQELLKFHSEYNNLATRDEPEYVRFIDTYSASTHVSHDIRYYFLNPLYFNLKPFEPFFEFYRSEFIDEFSTLYDLIVDFRIAQRTSIVGLTIQQLAKEIDAFLEIKKSKQVRFISKLIIAYFASTEDHILSENFKAYQTEPEFVRLFLRYNQRLKPFARRVDLKHTLVLEINDFEDMVRLSLERNEPIDYDGFFGDSLRVKKILTRAEPFIKEFLIKLSKSTSQEDNALATRIINELLKWISNITPLEKLTQEEYDSLRNRIFELLLDFTQSEPRKLLVTLLEQIDNESSRFLIAFNKFILFMNQPTVQTKLEALVKKLEADDLLGICAELFTDNEVYKTNPIKVCEGKKFEKHLFKDNFSIHFAKLISFVRMFQYYQAESSSNSVYFEQYVLILINRSFVQLGKVPEDYILNFDKFVLESVQSNPTIDKLRKIMRGPEMMHDLARIINLTAFFENDLLKLKTSIRNIHFDTIFFVEISSLFKFYETADTKEAFVAHLQRLFDNFKDSEAHYHFNNIYMLTHFYIHSQDETLAVNDLTPKLNDIFHIVNTFTDSMNNNPVKQSDIRVSKVEATFYFADYLPRLFKKKIEKSIKSEQERYYQISDTFVNFFQAKFYELTDIEKILFIVRNFNKNVKTDIFGNVEGLKQPYNEKAIQETDKGKFVEHFFKKHASSTYPAERKNSLINLEVFAHIAYDYFFVLYEKNFVDAITENQVWKYMIPHLFKLYFRKRTVNYRSQAAKVFALVSEEDFYAHDNLYLMAHFIFNQAVCDLNEKKGIEVPEAEFKAQFNIFIDRFYQDYAAEFHKHASIAEFDDLKFYVQNFYIIHKIIFARILDLSLESKADGVAIDRLKVPAAAAYFQISEANGKFFEGLKTEASPAWVKSVRDFNLSSTRRVHQFDNFLEFEVSDIFADGCRYEEFNMYLRVREIDANMDLLSKIIRKCINHPKGFINDKNVNVNEREAYKLLKALTVSDPEFKGNSQEFSFKKEQLFEQVWDKAKLVLETNSLHNLLKSIILKDKNYVVEAYYIEFVQSVLRKINLNALGDFYDKSVALSLVSGSLKEEIINHYLKDFFSFYESGYEYNFSLDELTGSRIYKIVTINSEAIYPLTRLASDVRYSTKQLPLLFSLYFVASQFRYLKISTSSDDPMKYLKNSDQFNVDFEEFLNSISKQTTNKQAQAVILYAKLVHFTYNIRKLQDFNVESTFNCALISHLKYISEAADLDNIDLEAFSELLSSNDAFKHNLLTYNAKANELIDLKKTLNKSSKSKGLIKSPSNSISSKFESCDSTVKNSYGDVLANWIKFSSRVFPADTETSDSNYFTASKNAVHISRPVNAFSSNPDKNLL